MVHEDVHDEFIAKVKVAVETQLKFGDAYNGATQGKINMRTPTQNIKRNYSVSFIGEEPEMCGRLYFLRKAYVMILHIGYFETPTNIFASSVLYFWTI